MAALLGLLFFGAAGCALHSAQEGRAVLTPGHADLDVLVRHHPGWSGVAQYDLALARLRRASVRLDRPAEVSALASLPALDVPSPPSPSALLPGEAQQLEQIRRRQVAQVRERRALARQRELAPLQQAWQRDADAEYTRATRRAQGAYLRGSRQILAEGDVQRLNLTLQIKALRDIVDNWKASTPPTPRLTQARQDLTAKMALLARLDAEKSRRLRVAAAERTAAIARAVAARDGYVQRLTAQKEATLRAQDERQTAAFAQNLAAQQQALIRAQSAPVAVAIVPAGGLGADALPPGPPPLALSAASTDKAARQLRLAETRLAAQRARWLAFIYDDTRAAALDAAQKRHWTVTFAKNGPGPALTGPLVQILSSQGWKT